MIRAHQTAAEVARADAALGTSSGVTMVGARDKTWQTVSPSAARLRRLPTIRRLVLAPLSPSSARLRLDRTASTSFGSHPAKQCTRS